MEFLRLYGPIFMGILVQTMYLAYRLGRIEEKLEAHEYRIGRLERSWDTFTGRHRN